MIIIRGNGRNYVKRIVNEYQRPAETMQDCRLDTFEIAPRYQGQKPDPTAGNLIP